MNVLVTTFGPQFLPHCILDESEIIAGPFEHSQFKAGEPKFLKVPRERWDISALIATLPQAKRPDLVLVHADATMACLPVNFPQGVLKVLFLGGATHLLKAPLTKLLVYASQIGFDAVVSWNRHHAHFFHEVGVPKVFWMPGLTFAVPEVQQPATRTNQIAFVGQVGMFHPRRNRLVKALQESGLPCRLGPMPRLKGMELMASSTVCFNGSLNGEFNLRVFEAAATGAMLLTDKLAPHAGLDHFFTEGESMVTYASAGELIEKARYFLEHPNEAAAIAWNAKIIHDALFSFHARRSAFLGLIYGGDAPEPFRLVDEPRMHLPRAQTQAEYDLLAERVAVYEWVQELHQSQERIAVEVVSQVAARSLADISDLSRVTIYRAGDAAEEGGLWGNALESLNVRAVCEMGPESVDLLICGFTDLTQGSVLERLERGQVQALYIPDLPLDVEGAVGENLKPIGLVASGRRFFSMAHTTDAETSDASSAVVAR